MIKKPALAAGIKKALSNFYYHAPGEGKSVVIRQAR